MMDGTDLSPGDMDSTAPMPALGLGVLVHASGHCLQWHQAETDLLLATCKVNSTAQRWMRTIGGLLAFPRHPLHCLTSIYRDKGTPEPSVSGLAARETQRAPLPRGALGLTLCSHPLQETADQVWRWIHPSSAASRSPGSLDARLDPANSWYTVMNLASQQRISTPLHDQRAALHGPQRCLSASAADAVTGSVLTLEYCNATDCRQQWRFVRGSDLPPTPVHMGSQIAPGLPGCKERTYAPDLGNASDVHAASAPRAVQTAAGPEKVPKGVFLTNLGIAMCLDSLKGRAPHVGVYVCLGANAQLWQYDNGRLISTLNTCVDASVPHAGARAGLTPCRPARTRIDHIDPPLDGNTATSVTLTSQQFRRLWSQRMLGWHQLEAGRTGLCLDARRHNQTEPEVALQRCDPQSCTQLWQTAATKGTEFLEDARRASLVSPFLPSYFAHTLRYFSQYRSAAPWQVQPRRAMPSNGAIVCWVLTMPASHATQAAAVNATWGPRCSRDMGRESGICIPSCRAVRSSF